MALHFVVCDAAHPDFVSHEYECGILFRKAVKFSFYGYECSIHVGVQIKEEIGTPQGDTIDDDGSSFKLLSTQFFFFFDVGPLRSPILLMTYDALAEFVIPHSCRGQIDGISRQCECRLLGEGTLSRALSAGDEYDSFH